MYPVVSQRRWLAQAHTVTQPNPCHPKCLPARAGLVEEEWLTTLSSVDPDEVAYTDFVTAGIQLAAELRVRGPG
jgi:hypothetical protein